jgi:cytochrome P450
VRRAGFPFLAAATYQVSGAADTIMTMDPPEHGVQRGMISADFMPRRIGVLRPEVERMARELVDVMLKQGPPVDVVDAFALPLPSLVICKLLGVPYEDHDFFQDSAKIANDSRSDPAEAADAGAAIAQYVAALIERKAVDPGDDLISHLCDEQVANGQMTPKELVAMVQLLLGAGHETTSNMLSLGVLTLILHPDQAADVRGQPDQVRSLTEELLRYWTINHFGRRRVATEDVEVGGQTIRAGEGVIVATDIANRDETMFDHPDRFEALRKPNPHMAFGFGIHQCVGQHLARMEMDVAFTTILERLPGLQLAVPFEELHFKNDLLVYGLFQLPVTW